MIIITLKSLVEQLRLYNLYDYCIYETSGKIICRLKLIDYLKVKRNQLESHLKYNVLPMYLAFEFRFIYLNIHCYDKIKVVGGKI